MRGKISFAWWELVHKGRDPLARTKTRREETGIAGNSRRKRDDLPSRYLLLSPSNDLTVKLEGKENWKCYFTETQNRVRERDVKANSLEFNK